MKRTYDFLIIGAGVFGAWIARYLHQAGCKVALMDGYGPANARASSGGETRVIRMGYGPDELYTAWAKRSLPVWQELELQLGAELFHRTGVLWLSNDTDEYTIRMMDVFKQQSVPCERLDATALRERCPELHFDDVTWALCEPRSGLLMARKSVQLIVFELEKADVPLIETPALAPHGSGNLAEIHTMDGQSISAGQFVFACGPWLPKIFPDVLGNRIFPSRQEVFFLGTPAGNDNFRPPKMPVWLHHQHPDIPYSLPDIEGRGYKIAFDRHGAEIDPDTAERVVGADSIARLREFLAKHIPALKNAPILDTRVCQYENTWNGDFLVDRHPDFENVWLVGGGSGHGFKHGPAMGEYFTGLVMGGAQPEPRFSLASKQANRSRSIY
jgi:sarcosine oxidase